MDTAGNPPWRKSTYSGGTNSECVEVATWRKSTYSGGSGECVEVATWRKSTHSGGSGSGSECVEAGIAAYGHVLVRDTKDRDGEPLAFPADAWATFTASLKR